MPSPSEKPTSRPLTYCGVFLVALSTLMLQVLLTRLTSVGGWYHLAFFVISLSMLGMTAGAVVVFVFPSAFRDEDVARRMATSALVFAAVTPITVALALSMPLSPVTDFMGFVALFGLGSLLSLPFVASGVTLTLALTRAGMPPGVVYGVDLIGAASGCALVIPVLGVLDAPSAAVLSGAIAAVGAWALALAHGQRSLAAPCCAALLVGVALVNAQAMHPPLRPAWVKGHREHTHAHMRTRWNSHSRVTVDYSTTSPPTFWAKGSKTPPEMLAPIEQRLIAIDGAAGTTMVKLGGSAQGHAYLGWDVTSAAHHLRPHGPAAVIGVGGGRDVLEAVRVGHTPVFGIELNQLIIDLHHGEMAEFAGIARLPGVELVSDEARSFLARDERRYDVITMSLIDTWASTGTGAYSLSENGLYTVEAWQTFLSRLTPNGLLSVSRWYVVDSPGETARMLALAMETIWRNGGTTPQQHLLLLQSESVSTLLLSPTPLANADIDAAEQLCEQRGFNVLISPRSAPSHPLLGELMSQPSSEALEQWADGQALLDYSAPTDARPFFFTMLKPTAWLRDARAVNQLDLTFLGNLAATQTLIYATLVSLLLTLTAVVFPIARRASTLRALPRLDVLAALAYFALIGLGFMLVEIGLLSRLTVFLGHPTVALAVLLGGIILFTGFGSLLSGRIDLDRPRVARAYPLIPTLLVLGAAASMQPLMHAFEAAQTPLRIAVSLLLVAVPALGLGLCFPLGLRLSERMEARCHPRDIQLRDGDQRSPQLGPWLWGINGACGVCASGLGLGISMIAGIHVTLLCGAGCYAMLLLCTWRLAREGRAA